MFRPEDWADIGKKCIAQIAKLHRPEFPLLIRDGLEWDLTKRQLFEAGADAIVEALKKQGQHISNDGTKPYGMLAKSLKRGEKGWLIFIPD